MTDRNEKHEVHALGLVSGGLDSTLAAALLMKQGISVTGLNFYTGFCVIEHHRQMKDKSPEKYENPALKAERNVLFPVELIDISKEYLELVTNPRYGYGKNANPCIDCRIMMLEKAKALMEKHEADFLFTGEVIGQRPMTQMRRTLDLIERKSGVQGMLLRPLSAKLLPQTKSELEGLVDREQLLGFNGRTRKPQMKLAEELGIHDYPTPAGGCCFLTDPGYTRKFFDLLDHRKERTVTAEDFNLLKIGRHLRVKDDLKVMVGRNERENDYIERFVKGMVSFQVDGPPGPISLMEGADTPENREICAGITARYSDAPEDSSVSVIISDEIGDSIIVTLPVKREDTDKWVIK